MAKFRGRVTDAHVEAAHAHERLGDLAVIDGGTKPGRKRFYSLRRFIRSLPRGERHFTNRHLDSPGPRGYIPGRDIANLFRGERE